MNNVIPYPEISLEMHEDSENKATFSEPEKSIIRRHKIDIQNFFKTLYRDDPDAIERIEEILDV